MAIISDDNIYLEKVINDEQKSIIEKITSDEEYLEYIGKINVDRYYNYLVLNNENIIGYVNFSNDLSFGVKSTDINIFIIKEFRILSINSLMKTISFAFNELDVDVCRFKVYKYNTRMNKILKYFGISHSGKITNKEKVTYYYSITKDEFSEIRNNLNFVYG